jgi:integrase
VPSRKQARIPAVWDPADVARILEAVDRGSPCGKRDYAVILLVTRLGLRSIDVKRLEFSDFDWQGCRLSVAQAKTGRRVQLPLLKDVGWAVIDYVRAGRPTSDCPQVFLRHTAPVGPFSDQDHLHQILVKHARTALSRWVRNAATECIRFGTRWRPGLKGAELHQMQHSVTGVGTL